MCTVCMQQLLRLRWLGRSGKDGGGDGAGEGQAGDHLGGEVGQGGNGAGVFGGREGERTRNRMMQEGGRAQGPGLRGNGAHVGAGGGV